MLRQSLVILCLLASAGSLCAQDNFARRWEARTSKTQSTQPSWSVPLLAPYPMLIQVFRMDATRQITPSGSSTWNYGAGRGLNLIPGFNSEFDVYNPPYIQHNTASARDGFGDVGFLYKYRIVSGNQKHGDYAVSAQIVATVPTGTYTNGSTDASIAPTLLAGKGFGRFDVIASLGGNLPASNTVKLGRSIAWNTTLQYHLGKYLWPEIGTNTTYFFGGKNDGKSQNFVTPGITTSKFKFHPNEERSRLGIAVGAGMQIATSGFHGYNHQLVLTSRFIF